MEQHAVIIVTIGKLMNVQHLRAPLPLWFLPLPLPSTGIFH
jgi:hypothetical protein